MANKDYSLLYNVSILSKENMSEQRIWSQSADSLNLLMSKMKISNLH